MLTQKRSDRGSIQLSLDENIDWILHPSGFRMTYGSFYIVSSASVPGSLFFSTF
jgi:hypothetical protein